MIKINALGKPCPIPVIETKKAIRQLGSAGGTIQVQVDNDVARQNLEKLAKGLGHKFTYHEDQSDCITVIIDVSETQQTASGEVNPASLAAKAPKQGAGLVIAFGSDEMGQGAEQLGKLLMKSYIYSLTELDTAPEHLLFLNRGAFLTNANSECLNDLQILADKGTLISTCGTCLDFYEIKDKLAIGEISNMYGISEVLALAENAIIL